MKKLLVAVVVACGFAAFANEWYIDAENGDDDAEGTQGAPRKTLKGAMEIPDLAANDTVWLLPGDYNVGEMPYFDAKVSGMTYASTNRCFITKPGLKIRSTGGKDVTFVTGEKYQDASEFRYAYGGTRCFLIAKEATGVVIEGLTIRTGYAPYVQATPFSYGGGVLDRSKSCWVVDCKFSGGRASRGGGQAYGNALRTEYIDTGAEARGTAVQDVNMLVNCAIRNTGGAAPVDGSASTLVNCLITATKSKNALSQDATITAYNSIFVGNITGGNGTKKASMFSNCVVGPFIVGANTNDNVTCVSCVTNATVDDVAWASTASPYDWRIASTSVARGVGDTAILATIQVPEGYSVYTDLYGTPIPTEGMIAAGPAQPANWYVDATDGNDDDHGGRTLADAFKTIRKATSVAGVGDTIHVAPGVYGEAEGVQVIDGQSVGNRVLLPAGVTLESLEGAEKTFIVGAADPDAYTANYGTGPKAIRCVRAVGVDTHIRGFTLTGGHSNSNTTDTVEADAYGAAVYSSSSGSAYAYVEDCVISNNFCYGATLNKCRVIRSRVAKNRSIRGNNGTTGAAGDTCYWYGCIVDDNYGKAAMVSPKWIESCTIKQADGMNQVIFSDNSCKPLNTVLLSGSTYKVLYATNCMFQTTASTISSYPANCGDTIFTNAANMKVDSKFSPVFGSYAGIDAGSVERASISYLGDKDIYGNPRVMNGKMDIGAVEYDWRPNYAALLGQGITVETVSSAVHSTDDAVVVPSGSTLAGTLTRVGVYKVAFQVSGEGTATFTFDGKSFGEYVAGDYVVEVESFDAASEFGFAFEGDGELVIRSVTFAGYWYVNGTLGNDNNDGRTTKTPKATIRAATTNAVAGDVIHVAPGEYGEKEGSRLQSSVQTRVIVPANVRLQGEGAPYAAVIRGAAASEPEDAYGNGPDAVRCVYLSAGATLANFTLMDGHTPTNTYGIGSAVYAADNTTATVTDCLVTNNFGYLGTLFKGNIVRCRVVKNRAIERSCIGDSGRYYGCFFDKSYSRIRPLYVPVSIDFCTLGPGLDVYTGSQIISTATKTVMRNSVMMYGGIYRKSDSNQEFYATNCVFTSVAPTFFNGQSNCVQMALADMKLSADGVPAADSPLNNWGDMGIYPDCVNETDLNGVPRVMNGGVDAGAYEHDWRAEYKNDLGPRATAVTAASPMVVETKDGTVRIPSGTLAGTLKTSGATMLNFTVKGGTLEVYLGEKRVGEFGAADAKQSVELWPEEGNNTFRLAFTPNDKDGYAEIDRLTKGANGIIFMVR